jgi:non-heme chloroperoxidase
MPLRTRCFYLASQGYRCIEPDRRGHGRSSQPWNGNDMDTYADDLAKLVEALDLKNAIHVGHSTGGGEVARYIGRHGTKRMAKAVLIGAVPPLMLKTAANPAGLPMEAFDQIRAGVLADRSQFGKISACRSTVTTGRVQRSRRACANHSGSRG